MPVASPAAGKVLVVFIAAAATFIAAVIDFSDLPIPPVGCVEVFRTV